MMVRTGHWVARVGDVYLQRRSTQPVLVWGERAYASSFRTRREAETAVRLSGYRGLSRDVAIEKVAQTLSAFIDWRRAAAREEE